MLAALSNAPVAAADLSTLEGWRTLLPTHAGWTALAAIGLFAVAVAALSVHRPGFGKPPANDRRLDDAPIGRMRDMQAAPSAYERSEPAPPAATPARSDAPADTTPAPMTQVVSTQLPAHASSMFATVVVEGVTTPSKASSHGAYTMPDAPASGSQLFLALQHVDLSIDVLRRHLQREPRPMPAVWLMLLDLCRTHGREQTFQELAIEFHRRFNVCTPEWEGFPPGRDDPGLEAYPRLIKEITLAWGTHECRRLLERLLYDNRGAQRKGFTLNAYNDLIALRRAADAVLESIEKDAAQDAKASDANTLDALIAARIAPGPEAPSPLVSDLESQLESDLRAEAAPQSAIEREHPALAGMIAREWGNAAMSGRLCDMLARGGDSTHALSVEASEEIELLRALAQRLAARNGIVLANDEAA